MRTDNPLGFLAKIETESKVTMIFNDNLQRDCEWCDNDDVAEPDWDYDENMCNDCAYAKEHDEMHGFEWTGR